jgi:uncharacterized membrane protein YhhN
MSALPSTTVSMASPKWLMPVLWLAAAGAIIGATAGSMQIVDGWRWLHWFCKPLATALILAMVWRMPAPVSRVYRQRILVGIAFSLAGDVFLMLSPRWFVAGLLGFLIAHGWFVAAFVSDKPLLAKPLSWVLCLLYGAFAVWLLWPALVPPLQIAVPLYIAVLATMAGQAVGRARWLRARCDPHQQAAGFAAIGALVFMLSDSLLAWNRFMTPLPYSAVAVLGTYYVALWLIARSVDTRSASTRRVTTMGETER